MYVPKLRGNILHLFFIFVPATFCSRVFVSGHLLLLAIWVLIKNCQVLKIHSPIYPLLLSVCVCVESEKQGHYRYVNEFSKLCKSKTYFINVNCNILVSKIQKSPNIISSLRL